MEEQDKKKNIKKMFLYTVNGFKENVIWENIAHISDL